MSTTLLLVASAIFLVAFVDYNFGFVTGKNTPAFAAWAVFSLITFVNCWTYLDWTTNWINVAVLFTDFFICTATATIVLVKKKGKVEVDKRDKEIVLASLTTLLFCVVFRVPKIGNLLNQVPYTLAFIPTYRNAIRDSRQEPTRPWALWTLAFVMNIVALKLNPETQSMDYVTPVVCLVHHAALTALSLRKH